MRGTRRTAAGEEANGVPPRDATQALMEIMEAM